MTRRPVALPPLRVGTPGDYPPFSAERDGSFEGLDVDVARRFGRDVGRPIEFVRFRWPDLPRDLAEGRFDVAMGGVTIRPERALVGAFTRPVVETAAVVLVRPGVAATLAEVDRAGIRLAVHAGGHLERVARRLFPHTRIVTVTDNEALPGYLRDGAVEALLTDDIEADHFGADLSGVVRVGPATLDRKAYLAREPALAAELDAWLRAHDDDGSLAALRARWLGPDRPGARSAVESDLGALAALVDLRLSLMPAVAAAKEAAGLPVADPAQEERVLAAARRSAAVHGLVRDSVEVLFRTQMTVAREREREFLATPPAERPPVPHADLERELRPALAAASEGIVARAATLAHAPAPPGYASPARVAERLDPWSTPPEARRAIARAVVALLHAEGTF